MSATFNISLGGGALPVPEMDGLRSFNLIIIIPEPSTVALVGVGVASMWLVRRRK